MNVSGMRLLEDVSDYEMGGENRAYTCLREASSAGVVEDMLGRMDVVE
jgi:hypothetical protein